MSKPPQISQPEDSEPSPYPLWSDKCWISMAAESADGTGPRIGRILTHETNCPDGVRQRLCQPLGFPERSVDELELRVPLDPGDDGVCQLIVEEQDEEVYLRVLVHCPDPANARAYRGHDYTDCPVRVWRDEPLGDRAVIDFDTDEELPPYVPMYLNNVRQPDHGYHHVRRRRNGSGPSRYEGRSGS